MSLAWSGIGKQYLTRYLEPLRVLGRRNIDLRIAPPRLDLDFSDIFWLHNVILIGKVDGRKSFDAGGRFCLAIASGLTRARKKHRQFAGATFCKIKLFVFSVLVARVGGWFVIVVGQGSNGTTE